MKASPFLLLLSAAACEAWPVYQLHEWGTFTTVSGSDGTLLSGLEREEETLPAFAHAHVGLENGQHPDMEEVRRIYQKHGTRGIPASFKGLGRRPLAGVTVKMETPVIYFHSNELLPFRANVRVGFNGGTISQWYPQRSGGETLPEPPPAVDPANHPTPLSAWLLDFNKPRQGAIQWDVDILPPAQTREAILFKPGDNVGWLRARQPVTNAVRTPGGETEGYLFYRGIGRFDPGLKTTVSADETLHVENQTGGRIPYLVAFEIAEGTLRWTEKTTGLDAGGSISIPETDLKAGPPGFCEPLYRAMKTGLANCGLTDAEARSMVETWWHSYFEAPGLRVFWVLPREATDRLLPLQVSPPPVEIVRVLVGRSEVLRPRQEVLWQAISKKTGDEAAQWNQIVQTDRFGLAIQERMKALGNLEAKAP
ncbi:MAG: hypothetical protein V4584_13760 [Verrucomicrobiota bacterium]